MKPMKCLGIGKTYRINNDVAAPVTSPFLKNCQSSRLLLKCLLLPVLLWGQGAVRLFFARLPESIARTLGTLVNAYL